MTQQQLVLFLMENDSHTQTSAKEILLKAYHLLERLHLDKKYLLSASRNHFSYFYSLFPLWEHLRSEDYLSSLHDLQSLFHKEAVTQPRIWYNVRETLSFLEVEDDSIHKEKEV